MNEQNLHVSYDLLSVDSKDDSSYVKEEDFNTITLQKKILKFNKLRAQDKKRIEEIIHENELLKLGIEEKERTCLKLLKENDLLQQDLLNGKSKINEKSLNDKVPSLTNFKNLRPSERRVNSMSSNAFLMGRTYIHDSPTKNLNEEEEIVSKLSEEVKYFKNQHKILAEKLKKSEEAYLEQEHHLMSLEIKNKHLENEISKQKELIIQLKKSVDSNIRLSKELESSQKKLIEQEKTMELLGIRHDEFEKLLQLKNQNINELEEINELYKSQLNEFSNNLASEIAEKERMKRQFRIFRLNKCGNFGSLVLIPTLLILRKDINDRFILEVETNYSKITLAANAILELNLCKENPKKFSLTYRIERDEGTRIEKVEFEPEERESSFEICKGIRLK